MATLRRVFIASVLLLIAASVPGGALRARAAADTLPSKLTNQEFWKIIADFSEDNGYFRSDNLLSNEIYYQTVIPELLSRTKTGGVYLGVGPEQNFTYIAALKPKIVFITDIRRGNLHTQLMYKALFELSTDRIDFMSRLFTKRRPAALTAQSSAHEIQQAFWDQPTSDEAAYKANVQAIDDVLTKKHELPLSRDDLDGIEYVYHSFYWYGPAINYNSSSGGRGFGGSMVDYASLMEETDGAGVPRSYLANEENFKVLKDLEEQNLLIPVVGNFAGAKALRAVGKYLKDHDAIVTAFYLSNVEQYLNQDGIYGGFCANVAAMPLDTSSTFIRTAQGGGGGRGNGLMTYLGRMQEETKGCGPRARPLALR
jgi:hypothetical protein